MMYFYYLNKFILLKFNKMYVQHTKTQDVIGIVIIHLQLYKILISDIKFQKNGILKYIHAIIWRFHCYVIFYKAGVSC